MANQQRSWMYSPYHYCNRCWRRIHLTELMWIQGQLVCPWDQDTMLFGERETAMVRVLSDARLELAPDRKLQQPNAGGIIDEVML